MYTNNSQQSSTFLTKSGLWFLAFSALIILVPGFESLRKVYSDYNYPPLVPQFRYILLAFICALFFTYIMGTKRLLAAPGEALKFPPLWTIAILVYAAAIPPFFSIDLYEYIIRGRMSALYGLNPFVCTPNEISTDPLYSIVFWRGTTSCYGPLWNILAHIFVLLSGSGDILNFIAFKAGALLAHIASAWFVYRIAGKLYPEKCGYLAALFLLNPYLIYMNLIEAHNDVFMMALALAGIWLLAQGKYAFSVVALAMSVAIKYISLLLAPVFFLHVYNSGLSVRAKVAFTAAAGLIALLLIQAFSLPFGMTPMNILSSFKGISLNLETNTIPFLTYSALGAAGIKMDVASFRSVCNLAFLGAASLIYLSLLRKNSGGMRSAMNACFLVFAAYLVLGSFQFGNWYAVWIVPLILLTDIKKKEALFLLISFAALIAFWKRINFLMIVACVTYGGILLASIYRTRKISS